MAGTRQLNDPYVAAARAQGWRSRAAFKLIELDERFHLLRRGQRVLDLGAAPGGWSQVVVGAGAVVFGLDLLAIDPLPGAAFIQGDFNDAEMPGRLEALIGGKVDLVLSDMAPNTTGNPGTDHIRIAALADLAFDFTRQVLAPGGAFVTKMFQGGAERQLLTTLKQSFAGVRHAKPPASRKGKQRTLRGGYRVPRRIREEDCTGAHRIGRYAPVQMSFCLPFVLAPPARPAYVEPPRSRKGPAMAPQDTTTNSSPIARLRDDMTSRFAEALAFDDVVIIPAYSQVLPGSTDTRTRLRRAAFR